MEQEFLGSILGPVTDKQRICQWKISGAWKFRAYHLKPEGIQVPRVCRALNTDSKLHAALARRPEQQHKERQGGHRKRSQRFGGKAGQRGQGACAGDPATGSTRSSCASLPGLRPGFQL